MLEKGSANEIQKRGRYQYSGVLNQKKYISPLELICFTTNFC